MNELTPITAATAADPYPYYARLVAERPFSYHDEIGLWVAASAQAVEEVLRSNALRVRPPAEPVPHAIAGTCAGDLFGAFMRMTDGAYHARLKNAALCALENFARTDLAQWARQCADMFPEPAPASFMSRFPAFAIAVALGFGGEAFAVAGAATDFARTFSPGSADALRAAVGRLVDERSAHGPLLAAFFGAARDAGAERDAILANAIGFLFQSCDATAGLIGNTLLALSSQPHASVDSLAGHVARYDSPVQNTRRFAAADTVVCGATLRAGEGILVLIAAANRDPASRRSYTFGSGAHACPGERIACAIASAAVSRIAQLVDVRSLRPAGYRPSLNARIPEFSNG